MNQVIDTLEAHFESKGLSVCARPEDGLITMSISGINAHYHVFVRARDEDRLIIVRVLLPIVVPEKHLAKMSELILRINQTAGPGRFNLDLSDGEITAVLSTWFPEGGPDPDLIDQVFISTMQGADRWFPSFCRVLFADADPREEHDAVRKADEDHPPAVEE